MIHGFFIYKENNLYKLTLLIIANRTIAMFICDHIVIKNQLDRCLDIKTRENFWILKIHRGNIQNTKMEMIV